MYIKNHITEILCTTAMLLCMLAGGGTSWHGCILPMALLITAMLHRRRDIFNNPAGAVLIAMLAIGFVSVMFTGGDKQNALYEYEKLICFAAAVYAGIGLKRPGLLNGILICAAVLAAGGLAAYCGLIKIPEFTFNDRYILRLQSFFKYANTTALLLGCGYYAAIELYERRTSTLMACLSSCILLALYLTVSKAAIPIFLVIGTVTALRKSPQLILQNIICMIFTLLILFEDLHHMHLLKFITVIACITSAAFAARADKQVRLPAAIRGLGIFAFVLVLGAIFVSKDIDIFRTLFVRFDYMSDAAPLLHGNGLLGIGPGAWRYYQYLVQETQYSVAYIHNSWLQMLVEYGAVFFVLMLSLTAAAMISLIKKKDLTLTAVLMFIIIHSAIDINLSFGACLILFGLIIGSAIADMKPVRFGIGYPIALICIVSLVYMVSEYHIRNGFEQAYINGSRNEALSCAQQLEKLCPKDSRLQISLAALEGQNVNVRIHRAIELSPFDYELRQTNIKNMINNHDKGFFDECMEYISLAKKQEQTYVNVKEYIKEALEKGICTEEEYSGYLKYIEEERLKNNVIDRNELLEEIRRNEV